MRIWVILLSVASFLPATAAEPQKAGPQSSLQQGSASWYGRRYHGRRTASGEQYDMYRFTAAHRKLPFGTRLRVTHAETGRAVEVRVTDRGPFVRNRVIDLSYAAAKQLGIVRQGHARVRLELLDDGDSPGANPPGNLPNLPGVERGTTIGVTWEGGSIPLEASSRQPRASTGP